MIEVSQGDLSSGSTVTALSHPALEERDVVYRNCTLLVICQILMTAEEMCWSQLRGVCFVKVLPRPTGMWRADFPLLL